MFLLLTVTLFIHSLVNALVASSQVDSALHVLDKVFKQYELNPRIETYNSLLTALIEKNYYSKAKEVAATMAQPLEIETKAILFSGGIFFFSLKLV